MSRYNIEEVSIFADGLDHPECVAVDKDGCVWAGGEAGQIYKIETNGQWNEVANTGGFILGIAFSPDGWLAICDLKQKKLWKLDVKSGKLSTFATGIPGHGFTTPNYVVFDASGNLYLSDSGEFRKNNGQIFKFNGDGHGNIWHKGPFSFSNGMALSKDQQQLYVVSTWLPGVESVAINADGTAGERSTIVRIPETCPDGIALDAMGSLYISCYAPNRIYRLAPDQGLEILIEDWESHTICNPTNIAFGGDGHDLYIANLGRWHIAKLRVHEKGLRLNG